MIRLRPGRFDLRCTVGDDTNSVLPLSRAIRRTINVSRDENLCSVYWLQRFPNPVLLNTNGEIIIGLLSLIKIDDLRRVVLPHELCYVVCLIPSHAVPVV